MLIHAFHGLARDTYKVLQNETYTFMCLGSGKTALKFKYEI
jgi:hypothetical protein